MTTGPAPMCMVCEHFRDAVDGLTCDAFPNGIPADILENMFDHRKAHAGDHGIQFEADPSAQAPIVQAILSRFNAGKGAV